jgi:hypothetical protein
VYDSISEVKENERYLAIAESAADSESLIDGMQPKMNPLKLKLNEIGLSKKF